MTTETYLEIRSAVKAEIKILTEIHTANKTALKFNARYCDSNSAKFDSSVQEIPHKPMPSVYSQFWVTPEMILTCLHVFYNRLRNRRPHTSKDDEYASFYVYGQIEEMFLESAE